MMPGNVSLLWVDLEAFPRVCFGHLTTVTAPFLKLPSMPVGVVINSSEEELLHFEPLSTWLPCARGTGLVLFLDPLKPLMIAVKVHDHSAYQLCPASELSVLSH